MDWSDRMTQAIQKVAWAKKSLKNAVIRMVLALALVPLLLWVGGLANSWLAANPPMGSNIANLFIGVLVLLGAITWTAFFVLPPLSVFLAWKHARTLAVAIKELRIAKTWGLGFAYPSWPQNRRRRVNKPRKIKLTPECKKRLRRDYNRGDWI